MGPIIHRRFISFTSGPSQIPPHGRWRHLDAGRLRVDPLISKWNSSSSPPDSKETCRRLIDLFLVSVLLDAGAGNAWSYQEKESSQKFTRSEGLGVASVNMFEQGFFSGDIEQPYKVDGEQSSFVPGSFLHENVSGWVISGDS